VSSIRATRARRTPEIVGRWKPSPESRGPEQDCGSLLAGPSDGGAHTRTGAAAIGFITLARKNIAYEPDAARTARDIDRVTGPDAR
jgi:hypothetical protein